MLGIMTVTMFTSCYDKFLCCRLYFVVLYYNTLQCFILNRLIKPSISIIIAVN